MGLRYIFPMFHQLFLFTTTSWFGASLLLLPIFFLWLKKRAPAGKLAVEEHFLLAFLALFWISFFLRLQPYGYGEFVAFSAGPLLYLLARRAGGADFLRNHGRQLSWAIALLGGALSLHALILFLFQHTPRLSGLFHGVEPYVTYPNTAAMFLLVAIPFQIFTLSETRKKISFPGLIAAICLLLSTMAFVLTFSRGAYLAGLITLVAIGIIFTVFEWRKKKKIVEIIKKPAAILIVLLLAWLGAIAWNEWHRSFQPADLAKEVPLTENILTRLSDQERSADQSSDERIQFWKGAMELIRQYPWFGIGSDGFRFQYPRVQPELLANSTHPHNLLLKIALENGIPAALAFALFLLALLIQKFRALLKAPSGLELTVLAAFLALHLHLMVDYNLNATFLWFFYWLTLLLMSSEKPQSTKIDPLLGFATIAVVLVSLISFVEYRQIKNASDLPALLASSKSGLFQPLMYEEIGEMMLKGPPPEPERLKSLIQSALQRYPFWAELKITAARFEQALGNRQGAAELYARALALNSLNHLDWHFEYLLVSPNPEEKEEYYYDLLSQYLTKLAHNEHHTVATDTPRDAISIARFYRERADDEGRARWIKFEDEFHDTLKRERRKFERLFFTSSP